MATPAASTIAAQASASVWTPPPGVTGHAGEPIPPESVFFAPPPPEIGEVRSARTTLKKGVKPKSRATRLTLVAVWIGVGFAVAFVGMVVFTKPAGLADLIDPSWMLVGAFFGGIFGLGSWGITRFKHSSNFVGSLGCLELVCKGEPENVTVAKSLLFKDAAAVSVQQDRYYKNGSYRYTAFWFNWHPPDSDKTSFQISGQHYADTGNPPPGDPFNFARAIENAWYGHLIPKADAELRQNGYIKFYMGNKRWARLGRGYLEIVDGGGKVNRCEAAEIASAKLISGKFTLTRKDTKAGFFGPTGIFQFEFAKMFNGRLFLIAFERLLGIKLS